MQSAPEDTAAIIIEPILGEGGFVAPPPDFLSTLRKHCDEHNIVMIVDEVGTASVATKQPVTLRQAAVSRCYLVSFSSVCLWIV